MFVNDHDIQQLLCSMIKARGVTEGFLLGAEYDYRGGRCIACHKARSFLAWCQYLVILIGQHGIYIVGCIWSASPVAVTNTTAACHCSRAMHEHYRTHENIPIVLESSELIAFSTEADRGFVEFDPARTGTR